MDRTAAVALMGRRMGNRSDTVFVGFAEAELLVAQEKLEREEMLTLPWFLLSEFANADCTAAEPRLVLPSDFLGEYEQGALWRYDSALSDPWIPMVKGLELDEMLSKYPPQDAPSKPLQYIVQGSEYFRLFPTPDVLYTFKMLYFKQDDTLDTDIENKWLKYAPSVLIARAGILVAQDLRDDGAQAFWGAELSIAMDALMRKHEAQEQINLPMSREDRT